MSETNIRNPTSASSRFYSLDSDIRIIILAILVGIIGGLGAILFREMIDAVNYLLVGGPNTLIAKFISEGYTKKIVTVAAPTIGGLLVGALIFYLAREAKGHGVPEIIESVNLQKGRMRIRVPFVKIIASAITIGSTGSAGREGPIAQIGGGFASVLSQKLNLSAEESKILVVSGVSAGIAATFNAPLGGVLFGLEVIRRDKRSFTILPLVTSSVVGTAIGEYFLGTSPAFIFPRDSSYLHIANVPIFIFLGIVMGIVAVIWTKGFYGMEDLLERVPTTPIILAGLGGLSLGIIELWYPEMSGISYLAIDRAFDLQLSLQVVLVLAVMKFFATALTIGSGGSGGVFAPTLFIGVMLGTGIGFMLESTGYVGLSVPVIALLCMAALFAGSARAPLTAVVMTSEMVDDFQLIIPLMFVVLSSWVVSKTLMNDDIYIIKLKRRGLEFSSSIDVLEDIPVSSIMIKRPLYVSSKDRLEVVIDLMKKSGHTGFPVVDNHNLVGIITEHDVTKAVDGAKLDDWVVGDLCSKNVIAVARTCPISTVLLTMTKHNVNRMPVISSRRAHHLVGWVTRSDVMNAYFAAKASKMYEDVERDLFESLEDGTVEFGD